MSPVAILFALITVTVALPTQDGQDPSIQNVITVPPNCPEGQELVNGQCREIWNVKNNPNIADLGVIDPSIWFRNRNVITVPTNCPPGQQLINGVCRDVWRFFVPTTPLPKQIENSDLETRDKRQADTDVNIDGLLEILGKMNRNIINIPNQCPIGYKPDALGICRKILD